MKDIKVIGNTIYYKGYEVGIDSEAFGEGGSDVCFFIRRDDRGFDLPEQDNLERVMQWIDEQEIKSETD